MPPVSISSKPDAVPLGREPLAVAGDARLGRGDRLGAADQAVDERRLADVGEADDRDGGGRDVRAGLGDGVLGRELGVDLVPVDVVVAWLVVVVEGGRLGGPFAHELRGGSLRVPRVSLRGVGEGVVFVLGLVRGVGGGEASFLGEGDDAGDDLFQGQAGGVEFDRVVGGAEGAVLALGVAGVAGLLGGEDRWRGPRRSRRRGGGRAPRRRR